MHELQLLPLYVLTAAAPIALVNRKPSSIPILIDNADPMFPITKKMFDAINTFLRPIDIQKNKRNSLNPFGETGHNV